MMHKGIGTTPPHSNPWNVNQERNLESTFIYPSLTVAIWVVRSWIRIVCIRRPRFVGPFGWIVRRRSVHLIGGIVFKYFVIIKWRRGFAAVIRGDYNNGCFSKRLA